MPVESSTHKTREWYAQLEALRQQFYAHYLAKGKSMTNAWFAACEKARRKS